MSGGRLLVVRRIKKAKGKRQKSKGKGTNQDEGSSEGECLYFCLLIFAFCLLPF